MKSAVIGIIFSDDRKQVLILQRRDVNVWVLPGGGVDCGESAEQAVVREVLEETGLHVMPKRKIGEYTPINRLSCLTHLFECQPYGGSLSTGAETRNIRYCPLTQMPKNFFPVHQVWIADALKNEQDVIRQPINQVTYLKVLAYFACHPIKAVRFILSRLGFPINSK